MIFRHLMHGVLNNSTIFQKKRIKLVKILIVVIHANFDDDDNHDNDDESE